MQRTLVTALIAAAVSACGALDDTDDADPLPERCTIEPQAITVGPQTLVPFEANCGGRFELDPDARNRSYSPDGQRGHFEYTSPELPGTYTIEVWAERDDTVRGSAVVTVEETTYAAGSDLIWSWAADHNRVRIAPDGTIAVESQQNNLRFLDPDTLAIAATEESWGGAIAGDFRWSLLEPATLYLVGGWGGLADGAGPTGDILARYDWRIAEVDRYWRIPDRGTGGTWTLSLSPSEERAAVWTDEELRVIELESGTVLVTIVYEQLRNEWQLTGKAYPEPLVLRERWTSPSVAFNVEETWVLLGGVFIMDLETGLLEEGEPEYDAAELFQPITGAVSPDGTLAYVSGDPVPGTENDYEADMIVVDTGEVLWSAVHDGGMAAEFFPDGTRVLLLDFDPVDADTRRLRRMRVVDARTGQERAERAGGPSAGPHGERVAWSPDGERLLAQVSDGRSETYLYTADGRALWSTLSSDLGFVGFVGDRLAGLRRDPVTLEIEALAYIDRDTRELVEELVLDFEDRNSRFLNDFFYVHPDGSLLWISSETTAEGGMAFDLSTGAWRRDIGATPDWVEEQLPPEQPLGTEPTEVCNGATPCVLHFVCGAWDPTGRWMVEGWNAGQFDARSPILSFRFVDSTRTIRRSIETYTLDACDAAAWHPSDARIAVLDGEELKIFDATNPMGD